MRFDIVVRSDPFTHGQVRHMTYMSRHTWHVTCHAVVYSLEPCWRLGSCVCFLSGHQHQKLRFASSFNAVIPCCSQPLRRSTTPACGCLRAAALLQPKRHNNRQPVTLPHGRAASRPRAQLAFNRAVRLPRRRLARRVARHADGDITHCTWHITSHVTHHTSQIPHHTSRSRKINVAPRPTRAPPL
jgi:hypothetical protein